ncbi:MAG TPA: TonB-dependent receptor [Steroidobacteraceae bacterium]
MQAKRYTHPGSRLIAAAVVFGVGCVAIAQESPKVAAVQEPGGLEEIVVTAQKRSENIQDVPIAITAVTAQTLETRGITEIAQVSNLAPNVTLDASTPFSGSGTVLAAYIRGIGQNDFAFNQDPGVGVYVDGVYLARSVGANTTMLDVDRIEILKGPQGTLFGRNTIGGAISIVTREPGKEFMFHGEATTGSYNRMDVKASMDLPITDTILTTWSFDTLKREGFQKRIPFTATNVADETLGNPLAYIPDCGAVGARCPYTTDPTTSFPAAGYKNFGAQGGQDQWHLRAKLVARPVESLKITLTGDYTHVNEESTANTLLAVNPIVSPTALGGLYNACLRGFAGPNVFGAPCGPRGGLSPTPASYGPIPGLGGINNDGNPYNNYLPFDNRFRPPNIDTTYATGNNFSQLSNWGIATTLEWTLNEHYTLKSISAYRQLHWDTGLDQDGSPDAMLEPSFDMLQHEFSEELNINGKALDERLNFVAGAYYFREAGHLHDFVTFPAGLLMIDGPNDLQTDAKALYVHVNFNVTDKLVLTGGLRYTREHKLFEGFQHDDNGLTYKGAGCFPPGLVPPALPNGAPNSGGMDCQAILGFPSAAQPYRFYPPGVNRLDFRNTSPMAGLDYHITDDVMSYITYSKGYKSGNWTTRLSSPNPTYNPSLHFSPEYATTEEVGIKSQWLERRLRANLAVFNTGYSNIQLNSQQGISPTLVNAGDARIDGAELETDMLLGHGLSFTAGVGFMHAYYTRLNNVEDNGLPVAIGSCPERTSDPNRTCFLPLTPRWKVSVGPQYLIPLSADRALQFNADWTYTSQMATDFGNTQLLMRGAVNIVNASATFKTGGDHWEIVLGGTNITDTRYIVVGQNQGGIAQISGTYNAPREWYATVRFLPGSGGK